MVFRHSIQNIWLLQFFFPSFFKSVIPFTTLEFDSTNLEFKTLKNMNKKELIFFCFISVHFFLKYFILTEKFFFSCTRLMGIKIQITEFEFTTKKEKKFYSLWFCMGFQLSHRICRLSFYGFFFWLIMCLLHNVTKR